MNVPAKGAKRRLAFGLFLVVWLLKCIFGLIAVIRRLAPSYPDAVRGFPYIGDVEFYVVIPAAFVVLNFLMFAFASRLPKWFAIIVAVLQIVVLLILLFLSTGGI